MLHKACFVCEALQKSLIRAEDFDDWGCWKHNPHPTQRFSFVAQALTRTRPPLADYEFRDIWVLFYRLSAQDVLNALYHVREFAVEGAAASYLCLISHPVIALSYYDDGWEREDWLTMKEFGRLKRILARRLARSSWLSNSWEGCVVLPELLEEVRG